MSQRAYIAGVGLTPFGRHLDRSVKQLSAQATAAALHDASLQSDDVQAVYFSNTAQGALEGQHSIRGQIAMRAAGIQHVPVVNVEAACASGSVALHQAVNSVRVGEADIVLALGCDKVYHPDRAKSFAFFESGWDVSSPDQNAAAVLAMGRDVPTPASAANRRRSLFMDVYAAMARLHMREFGLTQRQLAEVAAKNHRHSRLNPLAQFQQAYSAEEVLASDPISYPLTLLMCAPISDGAAAVVVCSEHALTRFEHRRCVELRASVIATGSDRRPEDLAQHITRLASAKAYESAGIGPKEISLAEVHDATAFGEVIQCENLGLCARGEGGVLGASGATAVGGRIPVNPSGGLESRGHPIGATGLAQIAELVTQLRGEAGARQVEGARFAIAENGGGLIGCEEAVACITILGCA